MIDFSAAFRLHVPSTKFTSY